MIHLSNFIRKTIPVATIPLLVSILAFIIKNIITGIVFIYNSITPQNKWQTFEDQSLNLIQRTIERSMYTYSNYTCFILITMILHTALDSISNSIISLKMTHKSRFTLNIGSRNSLSTTEPENGTKLRCQKPLQDKLKGLGLYISTIFFQYTLCYCLYVFVFSCAGYIIYSYTAVSHNAEALTLEHKGYGDQEKNLLQGQIELPPVHKNMIHNEPLGEIGKGSKRKLDIQNLRPDVVNILTLLTIGASVGVNQNFIYFDSDESTAYLFDTSGMIRSINVSDVNSPSITTTNFYSNPFDQYCLLFPDGHTLLYHNKDGLCITSITLNSSLYSIVIYPGDQIFLKPQSNDRFDYALKNTLFNPFPDSKSGFLSNSDGVYYLNLTSLSYVKVINFTKDADLSYFTPSSDYKLAFVARTNLLYIYNISDPTSPTLLNNSICNGTIYSITASSDVNTLFVLWNNGTSKLKNIKSFLDVWNISTPEIPTRINSVKVTDNEDQSPSNKSMVLLPDGETLLIPGSPSMLVLDVSDLENIIIFTSAISAYDYGIALASDGVTAFLYGENEFKVVNFFVNLELKNQMSSTFNFNGTTLPMNESINYVTASLDGSTLYLASDQKLDIYRVSDHADLIYNGSIPTDLSANLISLSPDSKMACLMNNETEITVVDIQGNITRVPKTYLDFSQYPAEDEVCAILPDQETLLFFTFDFLSYNLGILNMTKSTSISDSSTPSIGQNLMSMTFATNRDILALYSQDLGEVDSNRISIYNISNVHHPVLINETENLDSISTSALSSDNKLLFVLVGRATVNTLLIYDISNLPMIEQLSSISVKRNLYQWLQFIKVSVDGNTAIVNMLPDRYFVLDISDKTSPIIAGSIIVEDSPVAGDTGSSSFGYSAAILSNSKSIVTTSNQTNLQIIKAPPYAVVTTPDTIRLGEMTASTLIALKKNTDEKYNLFVEDYRFVTMALYSVTASPSSYREIVTYESLPNWIILDKANQMLYFTPVSQQLLGLHRIYAVISTKILQEELNKLNISDATDLMPTLISSGYLDNQGYITSNFDLLQPLILPSKYSKDDESVVHGLLRSHYIQTVIPVSIKSSLNIQMDSKPLVISTSSGSPLSVVLKLEDSSNDTSVSSQNCKFLKDVDLMVASTIQDKSITLEGQLLDINGALQQIIVNLDNDTQKCPGSIIVNDGLNPIQSKLCPNLSAYIATNQPPGLNPNISLQTYRSVNYLFVQEISLVSCLTKPLLMAAICDIDWLLILLCHG